jgi:polyhydroxyalkanoate synthesis regulator protein
MTPSTSTFQIIFYKNRKLYCKQSSQYITLSDVYNMHRNSLVLSIVEHDTNTDITKEIIIKSIMHFGPNYETKIKLLSKVMGQI